MGAGRESCIITEFGQRAIRGVMVRTEDGFRVVGFLR